MNENIDYASPDISQSSSGPFLARVVSQLDPGYSGMLEVEILRTVGSGATAGETHQVKMMSPFWGQTSVNYVTEDPNDYNNTQKSYGMWFVPPDVGTTVVVIFIDGDPRRGYWIGCIPDEGMNFMVPGLAATEYVVEGGGRVPVAEYNKVAATEASEPTKVKKPRHPFADVLEKQGLLKDDVRGITTSSSRREVPSSVFGISTPGPVDKQSGAKTGKVGKVGSEQDNVFVSRLGGTTFVMDDGDDKFLRKTAAGDFPNKPGGPPEYISLDLGESGGEKTIPHNELVRIRTRTGHQILLHNSEDLIYIGNARGTTWIELTSNGKIDIYAEDSISMHTKGDFNVTADKNINLTAKENINLNAKNIFQTASTNVEIKAAADGKITAKNLHLKASEAANLQGNVTGIKSGANLNLTSGADLNLKASNKWMQSGSSYWSKPAGGGGASEVSELAASAASSASAIVAPRVPLHEPWAGHENLHKPASEWNKEYVPVYTTSIDTFRNEKPAETGEA